MAKQPVCCARLQSKLVMNEAALRRSARREARLASQGADTSRLQTIIADQKRLIENDKQAIIDHEAEHAGGQR